ncbi:uncharacterized protein B0P05DRAFT_572252 [Gilbertella persicaria]|uniref:uncharacterized protein n=1 Tax=Gilbertella persicaria TaxID=101096 RepID=UPI00221E5099|nr:uncharacterized protein B0P05DRAFT_572252 [Gilbertella persicaria]KAI8076582.1 hypothetical protein B0P05DRAFT_572252 [Gilbertella persicaria]
MKFDLFLVKVKKLGVKSSQMVDDVAKVANLMKLMINRLVLNGVPSPVVCGLVDDGTMMSTYKMQIKSNVKYDFIQMSYFHGARRLRDLAYLPGIVSSLGASSWACKEKISVHIHKTFSGPLSLQVVPVEWLRPSYEYPSAVSVSKKQK